eukprot:1406023-Pyramimonas_sp.AAC.1
MEERAVEGAKRSAEADPEADNTMDTGLLGEIEGVINELGFFDVHVTELFGTGKFTSRAESFGLNPGRASDLRLKGENGAQWGPSDPGRQRMCEAIIDEEKPCLLIGSPMCPAFSAIVNLNKDRDPEACKQKVVEGIQHLRFC